MKKENIVMIVENNFPKDSRVRKEASALKARYGITVIALKKKSEKYIEKCDGVQVIRIPPFPEIPFRKLQYIFQYGYFTIVSAFIVLITSMFKRYKAIHVHNPPDTLFVAGIIGKIFSAKFIFDHHDLSPELYLTRFSGKKDIVYRMLLLCERYSCKLADVVISTNESYKQIEMTRHNIDPNKIFIVRNNPILSECLLQSSVSYDKKISKKKLLFLGCINPQDGIDILLRSLHCLVNDFGENNFICDVLGGGDSLDYAKQTARELNLTDYVDFKGHVYDRDVVKEYLGSSDIGLEPAPDNELNRHSTFIKVMEYMAAGKPLVAFDLRETRYSSNGAAILVPPGDIKGFALSIKRLLDDRKLSSDLGANGHKRIINEMNWEYASHNLVKAYETIIKF